MPSGNLEIKYFLKVQLRGQGPNAKKRFVFTQLGDWGMTGGYRRKGKILGSFFR